MEVRHLCTDIYIIWSRTMIRPDLYSGCLVLYLQELYEALMKWTNNWCCVVFNPTRTKSWVNLQIGWNVRYRIWYGMLTHDPTSWVIWKTLSWVDTLLFWCQQELIVELFSCIDGMDQHDLIVDSSFSNREDLKSLVYRLKPWFDYELCRFACASTIAKELIA